jgi:ATP-dependent Clp protease ATP-binding subunit ClpA
MQCIGATTLDEYRKYIERDAALERRFQPVMIDPPSVPETIEILQGLRSRYEQFHQVTFHRPGPDRQRPSSRIDTSAIAFCPIKPST